MLSPRALHRHPDVVQRDGVLAARIQGADQFPYQVDGDYLGNKLELNFEYAPDVLTLVVP